MHYSNAVIGINTKHNYFCRCIRFSYSLKMRRILYNFCLQYSSNEAWPPYVFTKSSGNWVLFVLPSQDRSGTGHHGEEAWMPRWQKGGEEASVRSRAPVLSGGLCSWANVCVLCCVLCAVCAGAPPIDSSGNVVQQGSSFGTLLEVSGTGSSAEG